MASNHTELLPFLEEYFLPSDHPPEFKTPVTVFYSIIITGSFLGNGLVILMIMTTKGMRTVTNIFLVSLAVSDILISSWNVPLMLAYHVKNEWTLNEPMCKSTSYIQAVNIVASIFALSSVAIER